MSNAQITSREEQSVISPGPGNQKPWLRQNRSPPRTEIMHNMLAKKTSFVYQLRWVTSATDEQQPSSRKTDLDWRFWPRPQFKSASKIFAPASRDDSNYRFFFSTADVSTLHKANESICGLFFFLLQSGNFSEDMIPTVGFNMRKVTKGNVTIKVWGETRDLWFLLTVAHCVILSRHWWTAKIQIHVGAVLPGRECHRVSG